MLVRLADWCLPAPPPGRPRLGRRPGRGLRPGRRVRRGVQAGLPAAGIRVARPASDTLEDQLPAAGRATPSRSSSTPRPASPRPRCEARAEQIFADVADSRHVVGVASPFTAGGAAPDLRGRHDRVRRRRPGQDGRRVHRRRGQGAGRARSSPPATTPCRSRSAARSRRCPRRPPVGSEGIGLIAAAIILLITFGSAVAMGLPLHHRRCSGSASRWRSARSCAGSSTSRTGRRPPPRWSASASASTTRCSSSPGSAAASPTDRSPRRATLTAIATAGRAVLFAGLTVVVSMLGILLMGQPAMNGFAFTVVARRAGRHGRVGDAAAGRARLRRPQHRAPARAVRRARTPHAYDASRWYRWSRFIQRRPWLAAIGGARRPAGAGGARSWASASASPTPRTTRPTYTTRQAYDLLADGFGPGFSAPHAAHRPGQRRTATCSASADAVGDQLGRGRRRGAASPRPS